MDHYLYPWSLHSNAQASIPAYPCVHYTTQFIHTHICTYIFPGLGHNQICPKTCQWLQSPSFYTPIVSKMKLNCIIMTFIFSWETASKSIHQSIIRAYIHTTQKVIHSTRYCRWNRSWIRVLNGKRPVPQLLVLGQTEGNPSSEGGGLHRRGSQGDVLM